MSKKIKLGVVGDPIDHSLSPLIHSKFGELNGMEIDYQPFHVVQKDLIEFIKDFFNEGGHGLNITLPHKLNCVHAADILSSEVELLGAANTLSKNQDEQIIASSTDGLGFIRDCSDTVSYTHLTLPTKRIV